MFDRWVVISVARPNNKKLGRQDLGVVCLQLNVFYYKWTGCLDLGSSLTKLLSTMNRQIPTELEWEDYYNDLDANYAHKIFFGKSNTDVQLDFKRSVLERVSELRFMPIKPFQYYIFGLQQYIEKENFDHFDNADAVNGLISLTEEMLQDKPTYIIPVLDKLMPTLEKIASNQNEYEADIDIYGSFQDKLTNIKKAIKNA